MDWNGIPVGNVFGVYNFAVGICADGKYEETECETPDVIVLRITIKDGDGDNVDDVNNIGDDSGKCDDSDDWLVVVDDVNDDDNNNDDDVCVDSEKEGGRGDITDDDEENNIDTATDEADDETVGVGGA